MTLKKIQQICEELEGEFGSLEARMDAAKAHIPSLKESGQQWIHTPMLFRAKFGGTRSGQRYDLACLLKEEEALSKETALKYLLCPEKNTGQKNRYSEPDLSILEIGSLNAEQEKAVKKD